MSITICGAKNMNGKHKKRKLFCKFELRECRDCTQSSIITSKQHQQQQNVHKIFSIYFGSLEFTRYINRIKGFTTCI